MRAKVFKNGDIAEPANEWPEEFLAMLGTCDEEIERLPDEPLQESRAFRDLEDEVRPRSAAPLPPGRDDPGRRR